MNPVINSNFLNAGACKDIVDFIDTNLDKFNTGKHRRYFTLSFGKDHYHPESSIDTSPLLPIKALISDICDRSILSIKENFNYNEELYVSSLWLAKQTEGAVLLIHSDTDAGVNEHIIFSAGLYLNDVNTDGELNFPYINFSYKPNAGELVSWPSQPKEYEHEILKVSDTRYNVLLWFTSDREYDLFNYSA